MTLLLAAAGVLAYTMPVFSESSSSPAELQQEINALQKQLAALEAKVAKSESHVDASEDKEKSKSSTSNSVIKAPQLKTSADTVQLVPPNNVTVSHYIGVDPEFSGSHLIINNPGINNDVSLLKLRKAEIQAYESAGQTYLGDPAVIFSGEVEGSAVYSTPYNTTPAGTNFDLTDAELDTFIEGNRWVSGFLTFVYNNGSDGQANPVNNSELQLGQGFVTIGDLSTSPFYGSAGQMFMPFGRYSSYMISTPSTKILGRIHARGLTLGYRPSREGFTPFAAVYGYQGSSEIDGNPASDNDVESYGTNTGFNFSHGDYSATFGMSYTSNIAESAGLQGNGSAGSGFSQNGGSENLITRVPGMDFNTLFSYKDYTLSAEYVKATKEFNPEDLSYNGHGAQPRAMDLEAAYSFDFWRPSYVAATYGQSWESLSLGVPAKNYGVVYSMAIWRNTSLSLELMHNIGYSNSDSAELDGSPSANNSSQGQSYNSVSLGFDLFF